MKAKKHNGNDFLERVKRVYDEVDALGLPDGAHWALVGERLGMEGYEVMEVIGDNPTFFGFKKEGAS